MTHDERIRQYAEIVLSVAMRLDECPFPNSALTAPETRATVSLGLEVEPRHITQLNTNR